MHYLEAELSMVDKRHGGEFADDQEGKTQGRKIMDKKLKKHVELVEKVINLSESFSIGKSTVYHRAAMTFH